MKCPGRSLRQSRSPQGPAGSEKALSALLSPLMLPGPLPGRVLPDSAAPMAKVKPDRMTRPIRAAPVVADVTAASLRGAAATPGPKAGILCARTMTGCDDSGGRRIVATREIPDRVWPNVSMTIAWGRGGTMPIGRPTACARHAASNVQDSLLNRETMPVEAVLLGQGRNRVFNHFKLLAWPMAGSVV